MLDAADDEADETKDRRCAEGKSPPGGVGAAIDTLYPHISHLGYRLDTMRRASAEIGRARVPLLPLGLMIEDLRLSARREHRYTRSTWKTSRRAVSNSLSAVAALFGSLNDNTRFRIVAKSSGMRFALDGDSQVYLARRLMCNPANENGDGHFEWPSPFEHRNEGRIA
jgi:hypothetical protein